MDHDLEPPVWGLDQCDRATVSGDESQDDRKPEA